MAWLGLVNTCWDAFSVLDVIGGVWSTHIEMIIVSSVESEGFGQHMLRLHFLSSLECSRFGEHNLRYISCSCWHVGYLVTTSGDTVFVLLGMCWVWSTQVEMHLVFSLALDGSGHSS
jgi:hypothetical protein